MLDTYVVNRLVQWANWRARKLDGGIGWMNKVSFLSIPGGGNLIAPDIDSQCYEIDRVVCALIPERRVVVMQVYTGKGTKEQKAKECGCCVRTYDARLDMAHRDILGYLNDIAAGVALPVVDYKQDVNFFSMEV
ncbi:MAG: hypothetical protein Q8M99_11780 [Methylotenera sp.]|nr:hypothetical protein [Methylotenera sp.]